ncbi:hypothetical protein UFVDC4_00167 [Staphylococcus phage vB_SauM-UFV_DC4]|nr:hypothetical protein UFVDC4_00167 [Staphylococcus phage vB_SauM-UFV_DC4]
MKYYKLNQTGIAEVLGISGEMIYCYNHVFREDELYLSEDEEIKLSEMITNYKAIPKYSIESINEKNIIITAYMEVDMDEMGTFRIASENFKFDKKCTVEDIYKIVSEKVLNKYFSFSEMKDKLYPFHYEEVTEEEYKKYKGELIMNYYKLTDEGIAEIFDISGLDYEFMDFTEDNNQIFRNESLYLREDEVIPLFSIIGYSVTKECVITKEDDKLVAKGETKISVEDGYANLSVIDLDFDENNTSLKDLYKQLDEYCRNEKFNIIDYIEKRNLKEGYDYRLVTEKEYKYNRDEENFK